MARRSILSQAIVDFVTQHRAAGVTHAALLHHFRVAERERVMCSLTNLRHGRSIHRKDDRWYLGPDPVGTGFNFRDWRRMRRAETRDQETPLRQYGEGLQAPRSASVWAYARHFQENRA